MKKLIIIAAAIALSIGTMTVADAREHGGGGEHHGGHHEGHHQGHWGGDRNGHQQLPYLRFYGNYYDNDDYWYPYYPYDNYPYYDYRYHNYWRAQPGFGIYFRIR